MPERDSTNVSGCLCSGAERLLGNRLIRYLVQLTTELDVLLLRLEVLRMQPGDGLPHLGEKRGVVAWKSDGRVLVAQDQRVDRREDASCMQHRLSGIDLGRRRLACGSGGGGL